MDTFFKIFQIVFLLFSGTSFCSVDVNNFRSIRDVKIQDKSSSSAPLPVVQTFNGLIRGFTKTSVVTETDVDVFLGVNINL